MTIATAPTESSLQILLDAVRKRDSERELRRKTMLPQFVHPATRSEGKSFNRREIVRRNKAVYGKRQIHIMIRDDKFHIHRDYHMPKELRKASESRATDSLEAYQTAIYNTGYRLLKATPKTLTYQYEGRLK